MSRQIQLFLCAVQFLTRIPVPKLQGFAPDWISRSAKYFPLVGALVGTLSAAVLLLAGQVWPGWIPAILAVTAGVLITGAFHEDGLADTADGLGGGQNRAQRLTIMKDSRIGTFGALALGLCLALKVAALSLLGGVVAATCLVAAHGAARAVAVAAMYALPYAGDPEAAKVKPVPEGITGAELCLALILGALPLLLVPSDMGIRGVVLGVVFAAVIVMAAQRLVGGQTGDILGAIEQMFETGFLLGAAVVTA